MSDPASAVAARESAGSGVLAVENLNVRFATPAGPLHAVRGVSFHVAPGETLGIVGESGAGKSVTALAVLGLIPRTVGTVSGTAIHFEGDDLITLAPERLRKIRGNKIAMIFQEPMTSLNPVFTIGTQIAEAVRLHLHLKRREAFDYAVEMLGKVGIPLPAQRSQEYPHQLSGGMRQRVMIAMALACKPLVLLADEPTTALDVTIQAQIIDLMMKLQEESGMAIVLISHDMGLVAETCDRVAIMYAGKIVDEAASEQIFDHPLHPYTVGLLNSIPRLRTTRTAAKERKLRTIPGVVPNLVDLPQGCAFHPRCPKVMSVCSVKDPVLQQAALGHSVRCWLHHPPNTATS